MYICIHSFKYTCAQFDFSSVHSNHIDAHLRRLCRVDDIKIQMQRFHYHSSGLTSTDPPLALPANNAQPFRKFETELARRLLCEHTILCKHTSDAHPRQPAVSCTSATSDPSLVRGSPIGTGTPWSYALLSFKKKESYLDCSRAPEKSWKKKLPLPILKVHSKLPLRLRFFGVEETNTRERIQRTTTTIWGVERTSPKHCRVCAGKTFDRKQGSPPAWKGCPQRACPRPWRRLLCWQRPQQHFSCTRQCISQEQHIPCNSGSLFRCLRLEQVRHWADILHLHG